MFKAIGNYNNKKRCVLSSNGNEWERLNVIRKIEDIEYVIDQSDNEGTIDDPIDLKFTLPDISDNLKDNIFIESNWSTK